MGNFADKKLSQEKRQERVWERKKANEKYYSDLSKLTFAGLVLSQLPLLYEGKVSITIVCVGLAMTVTFKVIGNKFLKS